MKLLYVFLLTKAFPIELDLHTESLNTNLTYNTNITYNGNIHLLTIVTLYKIINSGKGRIASRFWGFG
jgi:hypothetical protein